MSILLKNALIVTVNAENEVVEEGSILISDTQIKSIFQKGANLPQADTIIDCTNKMVMPGWINTHTHSAMTVYRGLADDLPLMEWLEKHIWPAEAKFGNEANVRIGGQLAMYEMIQSGTTTFNDMYFFQEAMAQEVENVGMRAILGEGILDFPTPTIKDPAQAFDFVEQQIENWKGHALVDFAISPHAPYTVSKERLTKAKQLADKHSLLLHTHLSETQFEVHQSNELHGMSPVAYLDSIGILDKNTISAHCVHLDQKDIDIVAKTGMCISHNPFSNMKLASGIANTAAYKKAGINVSVGTDGVASNNNLNMFQEVSIAANLSKATTLDATNISAREAVRMGTIDAADALNKGDQLGSIEEGKLADLQIINLEDASLIPMYDPYSHIVYSMNGSQVESVLVNGSFIMKDRVILGLEKSELFQSVKDLALKIKA